MKKNFAKWVLLISYENFFTPSPTLARPLHTAKPCNKMYASLLCLLYLRIVNVEHSEIRVQSGSRQSAGINPVRAKVSINFAAQSSFI